MDAVTYLKEKNRLTEGCEKNCRLCKLSRTHNNKGCSCSNLEHNFPEEAVKIIEEWIKEVEWMNIEVDTNLVVSHNGITWYKRHFAKYEEGKIYVYQGGCSSYTTQKVETYKHNKLWED